MAALATLVDNFNDGVIAPDWGNAYGGCTETGGRARVPCVAGAYAGYQTAKTWTLAGSSVYLQVPLAAAANGATVEAQTVFSIITATQGTNICFNINTVAGTMRLESNVAYYDAAATVLTYSATTHKWLRFREDGTNLYWDTSTDGITWTNRRTLATPAWVTAAIDTCALDLWSYRNNGTTNYAEFDFVNTLSDGGVTTATGSGTMTTAATATGKRIAVGSAAASLDTNVAAIGTAVRYATGSGSIETEAQASASGALDLADVDLRLGRPTSRWAVTDPWI